jgi:hypothetical protein
MSFGDGENARAVLVGADGANGITARSVGLGAGVTYGVAYESWATRPG